MKKNIFALLVLLLFFFPLTSLAGLSDTDKAEIRQRIQQIEQHLKDGNTAGIMSMISSTTLPELRNEIKTSLEDKKIVFEQTINQWTEIASSTVKVSGPFAASGPNWKTSGFSNYFIFEKINGEWLLTATDLHQKLDPRFAIAILKKILLFSIPIFILTSAFWIWMLIDCLKKPRPNMLIWVLVIIFLNILGAILYFFIEKIKK